MLVSPDIRELPRVFGTYFGRAANFILTGHFYSETLTPANVNSLSTSEQAFTVNGLKTTDLVSVNKPTHQSGLGIAGVRVSSDNTLAITFMNIDHTNSVTPTSEEYLIVAIRREKE